MRRGRQMSPAVKTPTPADTSNDHNNQILKQLVFFFLLSIPAIKLLLLVLQCESSNWGRFFWMWNIRIYLVRQVSCKPWELSTADVARCPPALDALSTPLDVMRSLQYSPFENATASNHEVDNKLSQAIAAGIQFAPNSLRIPPSNGIQLPFLSV